MKYISLFEVLVIALNLSPINVHGDNRTTVAPTTPPPPSSLIGRAEENIFVSEFEILDLSNHDGRLRNGYCCNGHWPRTGSCRDGNITCLPYWRVCIMEQEPPELSKPTAASATRPQTIINLNKEENSSKRFSIFSSFINRVLGAAKPQENVLSYLLRPPVSPLRSAGATSPKANLRMSPTNCNVGFFSSDVIGTDIVYPLRFRKPYHWRWPPSGDALSSTINRYLLVLVEIHSRNPQLEGKDRLISRQVFHYNILQPRNQTIQRMWSSQWHYGNQVRRGYTQLRRSRQLDRSSDVIFSYPVSVARSFLRAKTFQPSNVQQHQPAAIDDFSYRFRFALQTLARFKSEHNQQDVDAMEKLIDRWTLPVNPGEANPTNASEKLSSERQICPHGYRGSECDEPVCLEGCHPEHGYCEQPGQCLCRLGWTGMQCKDCLTLPGCAHGGCHRPFECRCQPGWSGILCSSPICREGCSARHGHCNRPDECSCHFGWQGDNCTECVPLPGCQHGSCYESMDCMCQPGWQGLFCSVPICAESCINGHCEQPGECRCLTGWSGPNCSECVRYPGCSEEQGYCEKPWQCLCRPGWRGLLCDQVDASAANRSTVQLVTPSQLVATSTSTEIITTTTTPTRPASKSEFGQAMAVSKLSQPNTSPPPPPPTSTTLLSTNNVSDNSSSLVTRNKNSAVQGR